MLTNNTKFPHNRIKDEIVNLVRQIASLDIRETGVYVLKGPERIYILYEEKVYMLLVYVESQTLEISSLTDAAYIEKTAYYDVYLLDCDVKEFEQRAIAGFPYRTNLQMSVTHVGPIIYSRDADLTNMLYKLYNLGALEVQELSRARDILYEESACFVRCEQNQLSIEHVISVRTTRYLP